MAKAGDEIGPYTLERKLGRGGFGEVWLADNPQDLLYQKVAIKLANSEDITLEMITSEARLWRSVSGNENIIPFIEAKNYDGQIVIASEFADGGSLQDYLSANGGKIGISESESILQDILKGLEHLHSKGIGHFDLKPANILIKDDKFCLADFGLSKILVSENTLMGAGTIAYSPPELFDKKRFLQSDIWSVGVILQQMLTGKMPFDGDSQYSLMFSIIQGEPKPLPDEIPQLYRNLISVCLQKDIENRFQTAGKMREAFEKSVQNNIFKNSIGMEFVRVPAGSFMMGSENGGDDEKPVHKVTISKDFYLGRYQVTQEQYEKITGTNPSHFKNCPRCPVENVSWDDAQNFIKKLNEKGEGKYRLPTEAEWEYACRAGTTGDYAGNLDSMAWYRKNSSDYQLIGWDNLVAGNWRTHPVGQKAPNAWRLYDMHGNVLEWCADWYGKYSELAQTDPTGAASGSNRVFRGGNWYSDAAYLRSASRSYDTPSNRYFILGFRVVRQ